MKRILFTLLITAGFLSAMAYDYPYLVFQETDGSETALSVESLELTVSDGQIVAKNGSGTTYFTISDLSKMMFSTTTTNVTENNADAIEGPVSIYSLNGLYMGEYENLSTAISSLQCGIYIVKSESQTIKIAVR